MDKYCCSNFEESIKQQRIQFYRAYGIYVIKTVKPERDLRDDEWHIMDYCMYCGRKIGNHYG